MSDFKEPTTSASATSAYSTQPSKNHDPYVYQVGFGNRFASEAIPGVLPQGQNSPQKAKYGLYAEGVNGTAFTAPRNSNQNLWLYRIRPSVVHQGIKKLPDNPDLESNFLPTNPRVHTDAQQLTFPPFKIPSADAKVDFLDGLKTVAENGDPTLREGLALHVYLANTSMGKKAFVNTDGDMLFVPQQGKLDIQTEVGKMMVSPGEIAVIQRGIRFKISLPDGPSRGYIQEVYGVQYELPELGPIGTNGLANPRDFEHPVASFDIDETPWELIYKVAGSLHLSTQTHTPFDVVGWHGNYVPYKYDLSKYISVGSLTKDHLDPSIWTVLTAKSKIPGTPLADFAVFLERWDVATDTFRPPFYHRNAATEFIGVVSMPGQAPETELRPGGIRYYTGFSPHGPVASDYKAASEMPLTPQYIQKGAITFMFESSVILSLTDWAMKRTGKVHEHNTEAWVGLKPEFLDNLDKVNEDLRALGLRQLKRK